MRHDSGINKEHFEPKKAPKSQNFTKTFVQTPGASPLFEAFLMPSGQLRTPKSFLILSFSSLGSKKCEPLHF